MNIEIKDLIGLNEPLKKFIEVVSNGVGALSKPYLIRKNADAKAYEIKKIAEITKENQKDLKSIEFTDGKLSLTSLDGNDLKKELSLKDRAQQRTQFKEQKQQKNIESVVQNAANNLEQEEKVSDEPVNEDWTSRFFNYVEDISDENMQELWGKILAGEVKNPKSYSLRTLDLLRNLSTEEAEVFEKFGSFAIQQNNAAFLLDINEDFFKKHQLTFDDRLLLEELGILAANNPDRAIFKTTNESVEVSFIIGNTIIIHNKLKNKPEQKLEILMFTKIGKELLQLIDINPKMDFIQLLATKLNRENGSIKYARIIEKLSNEQIRHSPLIDVPLTELEKQNKNQEI